MYNSPEFRLTLVFGLYSEATRALEARAEPHSYENLVIHASTRGNLVMRSAYNLTLTIQTLGEGGGSQESARRGRSML